MEAGHPSVEVEQQTGEEIVQDQDQNDRVDHRFGDGSAYAARAANRLQALMTGHHTNNDGKHQTLDQAVEYVLGPDHLMEVAKEGLERYGHVMVDFGDNGPAHPPDQNRKNNQD